MYLKYLLFILLISLNSWGQDQGLVNAVQQIATELNDKYIASLTQEELFERRNSMTKIHGYLSDGQVFFKNENVDLDNESSNDYFRSETGGVGFIPFQIELGVDSTVISAAALGGYGMIDGKQGQGMNNMSYVKVNYHNMANLDVINLKFFELEALPVDFLKNNEEQRFGPVVELSMGANWMALKEGNSNIANREEALKSYQDGFSLISGVGLSYKNQNALKNLQGSLKYKMFNYTDQMQMKYFDKSSDFQHDLRLKMSFTKKLSQRKSLSFFVESSLSLSQDRGLDDLMLPQSVEPPRQRGGVRFNF